MAKIRTLLIIVISLMIRKADAQISSADSLYLQSIFTYFTYSNVVPDSGFMIQPQVASVNDVHTSLSSNFQFEFSDFNEWNISVDSVMHSDTIRNTRLNQYSWFFKQKNVLNYLPFTVNGKSSRSYTFFYPDSIPQTCQTAYLVIPGNGNDEAYFMAQNASYHTRNCQMIDHFRTQGDVYVLCKPNEEVRAICWGNLKMNQYIVSYLDSVNRNYSLQYLMESMAMIKHLKSNYNHVIVMGLSEGGYTTLLASLMEPPNGAIISAGYSKLFDTFQWSHTVLQTKFDSLVDVYHQDSIRASIEKSTCQFLFTWGDSDQTELMNDEYTFHHTQNLLSGLNNASFLYDYKYHTFPPCNLLDTFINRIQDIPNLKFSATKTTIDTLWSKIDFCGSGPFNFDLYRNNQLLNSFNQISNSTSIPLVDSGLYDIRNIINANQQVGYCMDTIYYNPLLVNVKTQESVLLLQSAFSDYTWVSLKTEDSIIRMKCYCMDSRCLFDYTGPAGKIEISTSNWPLGMYILKVYTSDEIYTAKMLKR
ncbi:MAG: hypothetical protein JNJ58_03795 [Chitinophagaceae bacterium]|nr:hypothetical protein [Chitinophagaceae bacterium]